MAPSRALKKKDSHASEAEAVVDLELVKQASSRVANSEAFISGDALYDMAQENLRGFQTMFQQELEEQAALASQVSLTWASACSGSEGAFYVTEALSRAYSFYPDWQEMSLTHAFSCEIQKDKQKWIRAVLECGPLKQDGTPSPARSPDSDDDSGRSGCLFTDIQTLADGHAECVIHNKKMPSARM